jgi:hypothetical protein
MQTMNESYNPLELTILMAKIDTAIKSDDSNFLIQSLLSNDNDLVKVVHDRLQVYFDGTASF